MKKIFLMSIAVMALLSVFAWSIMPGRKHDNKVELRWITDDNPARRDQIATFNKLHPDMNLLLDPGTSQKTIVQVLAGVGPELFDSYGPSQIESYVKSDVCLDVTDKLKEAGIDVNNDVWKAVHSTFIFNGRVYGFPTNVSCAGMLYNKTAFEKLGMPYPKGPWQWKDFLPVAQKLTLRDKSGKVTQYGFMFEWSYFPQFSLQWGGHWYSPDGTKCILNSKENADALQFMYDLIYKYHVAPTPNEEASLASQGGWGTGLINLFGAGRSATVLGGRWMLCNLRNFEGLRVGAAELPYQVNRVYWGYGRATVVNKYSPKKDQAFKFLLYMAGKEYNELVNHQADGIAPMVKYAYTDKYLHDKDYPEENNNDVWRDTMKYSRPYESSPFIDATNAERILYKQVDLVKTGQKKPADALRTAEELTNELIQKNLRKDPSLMRLYQQLISKQAKSPVVEQQEGRK